ncbi:MAG: EAL domain-containing protein [Devosiaceae bacterium]|nr:EAL domain-containing protein [Devosiaceae bacterium]
MRGLVYVFIGLLSAAIAVAVYFGLTFTPIQAVLAGLIGFIFALFFLQRKFQQRDIMRIERAIEDLSRLLSTDAKAGKNLSRRLNELVDQEPTQRLETLEADISVLGTVVRQLAESLAEMEERQRSELSVSTYDQASGDKQVVKDEQKEIEPVIPIEMLRQALGEDRVIHHIYPIITLPQRRPHGYDLVPRLMLEDGELALAQDFMPISGGEPLIAEIEALALVDAVTFVRRALTSGEPVNIYTPISTATLRNFRETERIISLLDANRAVVEYICFLIPEVQWSSLSATENEIVQDMVKKGASFSLANCRSLRLNYMELFELGVRSIRADTARFIDQPASYTDFHTADIAAYVNRFEVDLIMTSVASEQHILTLVDDGVGLAQGPHLAGAGPIRSDFINNNTKRAAKPRLAGR